MTPEQIQMFKDFIEVVEQCNPPIEYIIKELQTFLKEVKK